MYLPSIILADGAVVPCYIAADQVQTPKEGKLLAIHQYHGKSQY